MAAAKKPILYYFDLGSKGRGEVVRLFLRELGIDYEDKRYAYDETWAKIGKEFEEKGLTVTRKLPSLDIDGQILSQHIPILRYLSRSVGAYDGTTNYEKWLVDAVADTYIDWRFRWVANLTENNPAYKTETVPLYHGIWDKFYSRKPGPYLLGNTPTYADFAVFQALDNDEVLGWGPVCHRFLAIDQVHGFTCSLC
ncbi:Glutathione S-transferase, domain-containing protein isoform 1 [Cladophialophora immunda]|nr:Glutathione S-transferase, domain-containing protein isoform 1 [Cladophialophora immunda]